MNERDILQHIKNSIEEAPIDIFDSVKSQQIEKMKSHDAITRQDDVSGQDRRRFLKPMMSFASVAAVLLFVFFNFQQHSIPDSQIYLDVNPGIEIITNKSDEVIELVPINEDAIEIIEGIEYKDRDLELVTGDILDSLVEQSYFNEEDEVILVSVYNQDLEKSKRQADQLNETIHRKLNAINIDPLILIQSLEESNTVEEFARKYGISVGKMTFIRNMIILDPELKTEDLVNLSLAQLIEISRSTGLDIEKIVDGGDDARISKPTTKDVTPPSSKGFHDDDDDDWDDDDDDDWDDDDDDDDDDDWDDDDDDDDDWDDD